MIRVITILVSVLSLGVLFSCSSNGNGSPTTVESPVSAALIFPDDDSECTAGESLNDEESVILFQWAASINTDSYDLNVRNLATNTAGVLSVTTNAAEVILLKNTPYEWFVVSKREGTTQSAVSESWRFYNAGTGVENYAPFPAAVVSPTSGENIAAATSVVLEWAGSDVDNDITAYEVFFGTATDPTASLGTTAQSSISATVNSGETYYWKVTTKDTAGNASQSEVFSFKVL